MTKFEKNTESTRSTESNGLNFQTALTKDDWANTRSDSSSRTAQMPTELHFDNSIYGAGPDHNLNADLSHLRKDVYALKHSERGGSEYQAAKKSLETDEQALKHDVFDLKDKSTDFKSFAGVMNQYHDDLKNVATDLWKMGYKTEASQTTAYYPLSHYEHEFAERKHHGGGGGSGGSGGDGGGSGGSGGSGGDGGGGSGDGSISPPKNATLINGLDNAGNERMNLNASQIGGSGKIDSASATQNGDNTVDFSASGGAWGDALWLTSVKNAATEQKKNYQVQLDTTFTMTASQLANNHEIEKDIEGPWGMAGTEINPQTGKVDFWDAAGSKWVTVGSLGKLEANKEYHLQIGVTSMGDPTSGKFSYDYYAINGQKLNASQNTFNDKDLHWAPGIYIQTQLDLPGNPTGAAGITETDQKLYVN